MKPETDRRIADRPEPCKSRSAQTGSANTGETPECVALKTHSVSRRIRQDRVNAL
jgi:hypothetical protein